MTVGGLTDEIGWGPAESETASKWDALGSGVLVVSAGAYWTLLWVLGGLAPVAQLASCWRRRDGARSTHVPHSAQELLSR